MTKPRYELIVNGAVVYADCEYGPEFLRVMERKIKEIASGCGETMFAQQVGASEWLEPDFSSNAPIGKKFNPNAIQRLLTISSQQAAIEHIEHTQTITWTPQMEYDSDDRGP